MKRLTLVTLLQQPSGFDAPYYGGFNDNAPSGQPAGFSRVGPSQAQAGTSWSEPLQVKLRTSLMRLCPEEDHCWFVQARKEVNDISSLKLDMGVGGIPHCPDS